MSISVIADPAVPVGITAVILRLPPTVLPPEGIPPRWAARPFAEIDEEDGDLPF